MFTERGIDFFQFNLRIWKKAEHFILKLSWCLDDHVGSKKISEDWLCSTTFILGFQVVSLGCRWLHLEDAEKDVIRDEGRKTRKVAGCVNGCGCPRCLAKSLGSGMGLNRMLPRGSFMVDACDVVMFSFQIGFGSVCVCVCVCLMYRWTGIEEKSLLWGSVGIHVRHGDSTYQVRFTNMFFEEKNAANYPSIWSILCGRLVGSGDGTCSETGS